MQGDVEWYRGESEKVAHAPFRCPYATPDRCPRYFQSLGLVEKIGGCAMDSQLQERLQQRWSEDTIISGINETAPAVMHGNGEFSMLTNFCPEVTHDILGYFASGVYSYADEIDRDLAHAALTRKNAPSDDPRWRWSSITPLHYRECPTYSLLQPVPATQYLPAKAITPENSNAITEVTRRPIIDYLSIGRSWAGRLEEDAFLSRLYNLKQMPSTDYRPEYSTAASDIHQHRVRNYDWPDDWVFGDARFDLLHGPDENFLRFLVETVHPVVRPDTEEARGMVVEYNARLGVDGWEIVQVSEISGKPVFGIRRLADVVPTPALGEVKRLVDNLSGSYIAAQAARLYKALEDDPALAIGTAKELLETVCKTILSWRASPIPRARTSRHLCA